MRKEVQANFGLEKCDFRCSCQSVSRREVQQSEKKTKQDFAFFALRGVEEEILQALPGKQDGREEEEGRHGREKKEATTVATSRPSCAKNSSVSALISIVCLFFVGKKGILAQDGSREWLQIGELGKRPLIIYNRVCAGGVCVWKRRV